MCDIDEGRITKLQGIIGYKFKNKKNLLTAITHSSYANEHNKIDYECNERLEFLGDSVLNLTISDYLFNKYQSLDEGDLTRIRAGIVSSTPLAIAARKMRLGDYLLLGKGEENTGGRYRDSILADGFEAVIGSIYIDGGLEQARDFVLTRLKHNIDQVIEGKGFRDYKTLLQEKAQMNSKPKIEYQIVDEKGPEHDKIFYVKVKLNDKIYGEGTGKTKKEAEQVAAKNAVEKMEGTYE
ncbi:MAG: ribonuclease III [Clostridia bacterium]|nr:ribonuclease III [Clostridia bacterium]